LDEILRTRNLDGGRASNRITLALAPPFEKRPFTAQRSLTAEPGDLGVPRRPPVASSGGLVERARVAMGSERHLAAWTANEAAAVAVFDAVFGEFDFSTVLMPV
jgi:hypothetical protein